MLARIYKLTGSPMQSGAGSRKWCMAFTTHRKGLNEVMGWVSSSDTMDEVKMYFDSEEEAISFAMKNGYQFEVIRGCQTKMVSKSYAENFN